MTIYDGNTEEEKLKLWARKEKIRAESYPPQMEMLRELRQHFIKYFEDNGIDNYTITPVNKYRGSSRCFPFNFCCFTINIL